MSNYEETKHYVNSPEGPAIVRFYPGMHGYFVTDPGYVNPETGKIEPKVNAQTGGGTSVTGTLAKGQGLMLWPMWEMNKSLKQALESTTVKDLIDNPDITVEQLLRTAREAHTKKSDRGKSVGTDAHAWVEAYSNELQQAQQLGKEFVCPDVPEVEAIKEILKEKYFQIANTVKPQTVDDWKTLPKLLTKEIEVQEALWVEATMVRQSILAAKQWLEQHEIKVHGAEDTVYSRKLFLCGKYDADWEVTCGEKCGWCYLNGNKEALADMIPTDEFTGRYIVDFKSTNSSSEQPKGIYPEYMAQCAVYEIAIIEEHPDRKYDGYLILNGAKTPYVDKKTGIEYPVFNTHFSFATEQHRRWATLLAENRELIHKANKEMKESNAGIKTAT